MGWFDSLGAGRSYVSHQSDREIVEVTKDYDYSAHLPQNAYQYMGDFAVPPVAVEWTDPKNYEAKVRKLFHCPISKACIEQRANAISNIVLKVTGNSDAKQALTVPNFRDRTMSAALGSWTTQLSIGGKLYLFFDMRVAGRTTIQSLRPDLVANNVKLQRFEYNPAGLSGGGKPTLMFNYDAAGRTTQAWELRGSVYQPISGALQMIAHYDPLDSMGGIAPGDAALGSVDVYNAAWNLVARKFASGGTMAGFVTVPNIQNEAEANRIKAMLDKIRPVGGVNLLANGTDFKAAQLTLAELQTMDVMVRAGNDICAAFRVSSEMVNNDKASHANQRASDKIFYRNFAGPYAHWLIGQIEWGVQTYISPNATVEVDETAIQHLEDDLDDKLVKWSGTGCFEIDECRAIVGLAPLSDGRGKVLCTSKPAAGDAHTGLGQPEEKPGGDTAFNADAGDRGDKNGQ